MPSSCGMFVNRNVSKSALVGRGGRFSMRSKKCFVSLMCEKSGHISRLNLVLLFGICDRQTPDLLKDDI